MVLHAFATHVYNTACVCSPASWSAVFLLCQYYRACSTPTNLLRGIPPDTYSTIQYSMHGSKWYSRLVRPTTDRFLSLGPATQITEFFAVFWSFPWPLLSKLIKTSIRTIRANSACTLAINDLMILNKVTLAFWFLAMSYKLSSLHTYLKTSFAWQIRYWHSSNLGRGPMVPTCGLV
jgi:hypothetical protein